MPLQKQTVDISLATGLDTESDSKVARGLLRVRNGDISKSGVIQKRSAFRELGRTVVGSDPAGASMRPAAQGSFSIESADAIYSHNGQLLLQAHDRRQVGDPMAGASMFAHVSKTNQWSAVDTYAACSFGVRRGGFADLSGPALSPNVVVGGGYRLYLHETSSNTCVIHILDDKTGLVLKREAISSDSSGLNPRGLYGVRDTRGNRGFIVFYSDAAVNKAIRYWTWDPENPGAAAVTGNIATDVHTDSLWDVCVSPFDEADTESPGAGRLAYKQDVSNRVNVLGFYANGTIDASELLNAAAVPTRVLTIFPLVTSDAGPSSVSYVVAMQGSGGTNILQRLVSAGYVDSAGSTVAAGVNLDQITGTQCDVNESTSTIPVGDGYMLVWGRSNVDPHLMDCAYASFTLAGVTVAGPTTIINAARLVAKSFVYRRKPYVPVIYDATALQSTYFVLGLRATGSVATGTFNTVATAAKILYGRSGRARTISGLSDVWQVGERQFVMAGTRQDRLAADGSLLTSPVGIDLHMDELGASAFLGRSLYLGGGSILTYDGMRQENGFHIYPDEVEPVDAAVGTVGAGTYSYRAIYEWTDRNGQIHRSAPSPAASITVGANRRIDLTVRPRAPGNLPYVGDGVLSPITIFYRTTNGGSIYYQVGTGSATLQDNTTDSSLTSNATLYTNGGELEAIGLRAGSIIAADDRRLYVVPYDDPFAIDYTKPKQEAFAPEWNDALTLRIDADGENTGLAVMDGAIVVFKRSAIYVFAGQGPNALGLGEFSAPRKIASDAGCVDHRSVLLFRDGVIFRSENGYRMLSRSMQVVPIGAPVDDFGTKEVAAAALLPDRDQAWFALRGEPTVLVYDYLHRAWLTHDFGTKLVGMTVVDGRACLASSNGVVRQEDKSSVAPEPLFISTPWYSTGSAQGYQRIWWIHLLGDLDGAFSVRLYYDYSKESSQTVRFDAVKDRKMVRIKPTTQKCVALRMDIEQVGDLRRPLGFNSASLAVGAKPGRLARIQGAMTR